MSLIGVQALVERILDGTWKVADVAGTAGLALMFAGLKEEALTE
jgi:hypothetical protein